MRVRAGLNSPELRIGQAAHDFCMTACAAPHCGGVGGAAAGWSTGGALALASTA